MNWFKKLVTIHFQLSQQKFVWFPFYRLKPAANERMKFSLTFILALCFGTYGLLAILIKAAIQQEFIFTDIAMQTAKITIAFFIWFNIATRPLWNQYLKMNESA